MTILHNINLPLSRLLQTIGLSLLLIFLFLGGCRKSNESKKPSLSKNPTINYIHFDGNWYRKIGGCGRPASESCNGTIDEVEAYVKANAVPVTVTKLPPETKAMEGTIPFKLQKERYQPLLKQYGMNLSEGLGFRRIGFDRAIITRNYTSFDGQFKPICGHAEKANNNNWKPYGGSFEISGNCMRSTKPMFFDKFVYTSGAGWNYSVAPNPQTGKYINSPYPSFKIRFGDGYGLTLDESIEPHSDEAIRLKAEWIERKVKFYEAYVKSIFLGPELPTEVQEAIDEHCSFSKKNDYRCVFEEGL